jgi:hypothetical protein
VGCVDLVSLASRLTYCGESLTLLMQFLIAVGMLDHSNLSLLCKAVPTSLISVPLSGVYKTLRLIQSRC